jgi:hypothetical protein
MSYFISTNADETKPQTILSGDSNMSRDNFASDTDANGVTWGTGVHVRAGNVGLGDGSVQQMTDTKLQQQIIAEAQDIGYKIGWQRP